MVKMKHLRGRTQLLLLLATAAATSLAHLFPYVPAQILMPGACYDPTNDCDNEGVAYILSSAGEFLSLNYSSTVAQADTITDTLPFAGTGRTWSATTTGEGKILAYAGECGKGGEVWTYEDGGAWQKTGLDDEDGDNSWLGPYFLGATLSFSSKVAPEMDDPKVYTYGGMCGPTEEYTTAWQSDANYTRRMMSLTHENDGDYALSVPSRTGPHAPKRGMAGFSLTELPSSITNVSGTVTQSTRYVILGGHLQTAFLNMSNAAVWNLPEETWDYIEYIEQPSADEFPNNDLAVQHTRRQSVTEVEPRSGHTAVLSEDGTTIVILGGWIQTIDQPALPQLVVLEMSQQYSGWKYTVPEKQPDGGGIYGHAAGLLPGNVMVVYGGWEIGTDDDLKTKRDIGGLQFLNLTSMEWLSSYTNPNRNEEEQGDAPGTGSSTNDATKLGLGLGLGLGLALLTLIIILAMVCLRRRQRKKRKSRDAAIASLAQDNRCFTPGDGEMAERDDFFSVWGRNGSWYTGGRDAYQNGQRTLGYESLRGSKGFGNGGGMASIPRKPVPQTRQFRGAYAPAQTNPGSVSTAGRIHPIMEDDEDEYHRGQHNTDLLTPTSEVATDPFMTPTRATPVALLAPLGRGSATPSPESWMRRYDPDVEDWKTDVDAADALFARRMSSQRRGRISPTRRGSNKSSAGKDDESRNNSNLSESSFKLSPVARRANQSGTLLSGSTLLEKPPGSSSSNSYQTAKSSFNALQQEGPTLLLGTAPEDDDREQPPGSPSKSKPRRNWLGSLRRVFSTSGRTTPSDLSDSAASYDPNYAVSEDSEPRDYNLSGEVLRRKQGRRDWEATGPGEDNEWDIERAVEQRMVQVMFSVPKERLRVVNADEVVEESDLGSRMSAEIVEPAKKTSPARTEDVFDGEGRTLEGRTERLLLFGDSKGPDKGESSRRSSVEDVFDDSHQADSPTKSTFDQPQERRPSVFTSSSEKENLLTIDDDDHMGRRGSHISNYSSAAVHTAEVVRMERPRTRVLRMVGDIESREGSPVREGSPEAK